MTAKPKSTLANKKMVLRAVRDAFRKLSPRIQAQNPVMLLVYISAALTTLLFVFSLFQIQDASTGYTLAIAVVLWLTVLVRQFCRSDRGRPRQSAGRLPAKREKRGRGAPHPFSRPAG